MKKIFTILSVLLTMAGCVQTSDDKLPVTQGTKVKVRVGTDSCDCNSKKYTYSTIKVDTNEYIIVQDEHGIAVTKK